MPAESRRGSAAAALVAFGAAVGLVAAAVLGVLWLRDLLAPEPAEPVAPRAQAMAAAAAARPADAVGVPLADVVDDVWVTQASAATGIAERAVAAYAAVEVLLRHEQPACHLDWATLAGIGWVETRHGSLNGAELGEDGWLDPPIVGIALDGTRSAEVPDTDGGVLDGDEIWDRAVGPMQFIPQTWERFAADGNLDGQAHPQQIDDAALAAGRYLCRDARDLRQPEDWLEAVHSYNASTAYSDEVAEATERYRLRLG